MYYCTNAACPAQLQERVEHFASRGAMDIDTLGEKRIAALCKVGLIKNIADIYSLNKTDLLGLKNAASKVIAELSSKMREYLYFSNIFLRLELKSTGLFKKISNENFKNLTTDEKLNSLKEEPYKLNLTPPQVDALMNKINELLFYLLPVSADKAGINREITWDEIRSLEGLGRKSVDTLLLQREQKKKEVQLSNVIYALGIRHVGEENARILAQKFQSIDNIMDLSREALMAVPSIGPKIADSILAFFHQKENRKIIDKLRDSGVPMSNDKKEVNEQPLADMRFVITGTLDSFTREGAEEKIRELGGSISDTISNKTSYLVVGHNPGSKQARAELLGVKQITENEFLRLIAKK